MTDEEVKMNGTQFEGKEVYVKDVFTEIAGYYDEMNEIMSLRMIQGLLVAFNGRVVTGAGAKPYLSVTLQKEEKPLELLQSILRAMQDILKD